eukprot:564944-Hanusia_phi.AAC.2
MMHHTDARKALSPQGKVSFDDDLIVCTISMNLRATSLQKNRRESSCLFGKHTTRSSPTKSKARVSTKSKARASTESKARASTDPQPSRRSRNKTCKQEAAEDGRTTEGNKRKRLASCAGLSDENQQRQAKKHSPSRLSDENQQRQAKKHSSIKSEPDSKHQSWFAVLVDDEWREQKGFMLWEVTTDVAEDGTVCPFLELDVVDHGDQVKAREWYCAAELEPKGLEEEEEEEETSHCEAGGFEFGHQRFLPKQSNFVQKRSRKQSRSSLSVIAGSCLVGNLKRSSKWTLGEDPSRTSARSELIAEVRGREASARNTRRRFTARLTRSSCVCSKPMACW